MSEIQAVLFDKRVWDTTRARAQLRKMNLVPIKRVDVTDRYLRYRISEPGGVMRTKATSKGFSLIIKFPGKKSRV